MKPAVPVVLLRSLGLAGLVGSLGLAGLAGGCAADPAPSATIETVAPDQLMPSDDARDDLTIALRYEDGDGDLGGGVVEIHDCRAAGVVIELAIPEIAAERDRRITGTLALHVNDIGEVAIAALPDACDALGIGELAPDTAVFCVVLTDTAGHRGDGDCTRPIALVQP
jgi:hypothetical protein